MCHRIHCILLNYAAILRDTIYSGPEDPGPGDQWTRGLGTKDLQLLRETEMQLQVKLKPKLTVNTYVVTLSMQVSFA